MARGASDFALNEINQGLMLPSGFIRMLVGAIGPGAAREIVLSGKPVLLERALEIRLVSEIANGSAIHQRYILTVRLARRQTGGRFRRQQAGASGGSGSHRP